ncbi:putative phosphatidate phosphatase [Phymastichus coffea]|uniref:putative phosphatidate phosphatase n=1 Tax=Phymastichus coffea TaxID=108790 RepID=UPI00273C7029|nr:putative phosphatidate phosphatase [Phymastichus coffea]
MDRSSKFLVRKVIIDFVCLFTVGITILMFFLFGKPYQRGFFCNDESLMHPFKESTVTSPMLYVIGLFLPICTMIVFEYQHSKRMPERKSLVMFGVNLPAWVPMAYAKIGIFGFGAAVTVLTTDIAKYTVGRLRPHFLTKCKPQIDCNLPENMHRYIEDFSCDPTVPARYLKELRLSFPSGHSSFSAYTMIYLALYLQLRMTWRGSKLLRHFLQFLCIMMAWFTAMTRISNYKHHWGDVLAGCLIGAAVALITAFGIADLFKERRQEVRCCHQSEESLHQQQEQAKIRADYEPSASPDATQIESTPLRSASPDYGGVHFSHSENGRKSR